VIIQDGLNTVGRQADEILVQEHRGSLCDPRWLESCRRRVADVTGSVQLVREVLPPGVRSKNDLDL
jgi:hypothetical protein